jgi:transcriptional regulator with GAF, ATPase, and Fis domain
MSDFSYAIRTEVLYCKSPKKPNCEIVSLYSQAKTFLGMPAVISSPAMRQLIELVERIAQSNAAVLITGESGSGKELVARAVHHYSLRCAKPWVDVSCAALPEHLVESELFGYEKGAFSGADSPKPGLFELAHYGTLFLDEVGELEPRMQVKLLRVLDGVPYYRLGGTRKVTVDVRIVAATNQDLEQMVDTGGFRGDLYHRLGQICLRVPPLRERVEDIVPLAEHFLKQTNPRLSFSGEALRMLEGHRWPGNVRELRNVVTKAAVLARELEIGAGDLLLAPPRASLAATTPMMTVPLGGVSVGSSAGISAGSSANLDGMEKSTILRVLAQTNGHQQKAAELLGISRRTLSRKLKLYGREAVRQSYAS